jgi:hypothetical protein
MTKDRRMEIVGVITYSMTLTCRPSLIDCVHATLMWRQCYRSKGLIGHRNSGGRKKVVASILETAKKMVRMTCGVTHVRRSFVND